MIQHVLDRAKMGIWALNLQIPISSSLESYFLVFLPIIPYSLLKGKFDLGPSPERP